MTSITWASPRYVQELATILGPQNPTQRSCDNNFISLVKDMESFMSRKDEQYAERRKKVYLYCSQVNNTLSKEVTFNRLLFNKDSGIMGYS